MRHHNTLLVWRRAHAFAVSVNRALSRVDGRKAPGLRNQLLRAANSIAANIAEGAAQPTDAQFARFVSISVASTQEVENHLALARDIELVAPDEANQLLDEAMQIRRMAIGLRKALLG